jgi:hypothetical protein
MLSYLLLHTNIIILDLIAGLNEFNDHAYRRFVEKLKVRSTSITVYVITLAV